MTTSSDGSDGSEVRAAIEADLRRVADRLAVAPVRKVEDNADRTRALLQQLADTAHAVETRDEPSVTPGRPVPELPLPALSDQVAVLGADLLAAVRGVPDETVVFPAVPAPTVGEALASVATALKALRLAL